MNWLAGPLLTLALAMYLATAWWHSRKPLPPGLGQCGAWRDADDVRLLLDETWVDAHGRRHCRQQIVDELLVLIGQARRLIVLDVFQFSDPADSPPDCHRRVADALCQALLARKREQPGIEVVVITDPINTAYGGRTAGHLDALTAAGVRVVTTRLTATRDPNPSWNALWRLLFGWWGNTPRGGWLANPVGPGRVTLRSYLAALNLNANHRKTLVVDHGDAWRALVSSANLDDSSSAFREAGLTFSGPAAFDLLETEAGIARFSGTPDITPLTPTHAPTSSATHAARLRVLGEGAIGNALLGTIEGAEPPERLDIEVLYLAHRGLIASLVAAHRRGVTVRVLLDPNHEAFGLAMHGIPNRPVAYELVQAGIRVRFSDTRGEQAHTKLLLRSGGARPARLLLGSANFTRRSLDNLNLEADVELVADAGHPALHAAVAAFDRHWHNTPHARFSTDHTDYADASRPRYWQYRLVEATGWCTF